MNYTPDNWIILEMETPESGIFHKILGGWSGGYLDGNSWRLNSGVTTVEEHEDHFAVHGYSGSVYTCFKDSEVVRMNIAPTLNALMGTGKVKLIQMEDYFKNAERTKTE